MSPDTITRAMALYVALDLRPTSAVEGRGFQMLVRTLKPRCDIPSRQVLRDVLLHEFKNEKQQVSDSYRVRIQINFPSPVT